MKRTKIILASDIHLCHCNWLGVAPEVRVQKFIDDLKAEYQKEPFEALLLLGDYSLDHWKWQIKGSYAPRRASRSSIASGTRTLMSNGNGQERKRERRSSAAFPRRNR